jgi:hypothetical protein
MRTQIPGDDVPGAHSEWSLSRLASVGHNPVPVTVHSPERDSSARHPSHVPDRPTTASSHRRGSSNSNRLAFTS